MSGTVHLNISGHLAELHLDNPDKMNALDLAMLDDLSRHCDVIARDRNIRAVLLSAAGERAFCTGADILEWGGLDGADFARFWVRDGHRVFDRLAGLPQPVIAALNGHAFGGGLELAAACDIRVMTARATLALPEAGVGIVPGWSGTQRLMRLLPEPLVKEMALFGRRITAERALAAGFIAEIADDAPAAARALIERALTLSPRATEIAKAMIHAAAGEDRGAMVEMLGAGMISATQDRAEGVAAFAQKRKPDFKGV
ncbi:MAG: enoyl-CoA hydratase/isomerase family protein [Paracoccus sp. (in: a-proteobacteria)]|nr:enoyl-CoA hydratase/isomerase family protein [Paracoccus sp. (in: a-proteobacteria)]